MVSGPGPDSGPPVTSITAGPRGGETSDTTPTFGSSPTSRARRSCARSTSRRPPPAARRILTQALGPGLHVFSVYAVDQAGNAADDAGDPVVQRRDEHARLRHAGGWVLRRWDDARSQRRYRCRTSSHPRSRACGSSPAVPGGAVGPALAALVGTRVSLTLSEPATVRFRMAWLLRAGAWAAAAYA